jgi:hypothetical protein
LLSLLPVTFRRERFWVTIFGKNYETGDTLC